MKSLKTLTKKIYLEIEDKMKRYCKETNIPMASFDLLLWYLEAGKFLNRFLFDKQPIIMV